MTVSTSEGDRTTREHLRESPCQFGHDPDLLTPPWDVGDGTGSSREQNLNFLRLSARN
jgi:hypothetical protein